MARRSSSGARIVAAACMRTVLPVVAVAWVTQTVAAGGVAVRSSATVVPKRPWQSTRLLLVKRVAGEVGSFSILLGTKQYGINPSFL